MFEKLIILFTKVNLQIFSLTKSRKKSFISNNVFFLITQFLKNFSISIIVFEIFVSLKKLKETIKSRYKAISMQI